VQIIREFLYIKSSQISFTFHGNDDGARDWPQGISVRAMQFATSINSANQIRCHAISGEFNMDSLLKELGRFYDSPDYDPEMNVLWDLRQLNGLSALATSELSRLIAFVSRRWVSSQPRRAALVVSRMVDFGMARMYEMRMESVSRQEIRVFTDFEQARQWLGINSQTGSIREDA